MDITPDIDAIRRFNRFYSQHLGVLDATYLNGPYNLPECRILHELARRPGITASMLAQELSMDMGYLSRLIAGLARKRMVKRTRSAADKRQLHLSLSAHGLKQLPTLEDKVNRHIGGLVAPMSPAKRHQLVAAMDRVQSILDGTPAAPVIFRQLRSGDAGWIIHRHGAVMAPEFGWDERFEAFVAHIMADFVEKYQPEWERSWIVEQDGQILGSLFLIRADETTAKLRLLYVEPAARGMGLATKLLEKSIQFARSKGYARITLFTTASNTSARRIYQKLGMELAHEEESAFFGATLRGETWELAL
ncbi:MAG: bifunctional helix-turn-helix transcriptional regulator/GNAT family N-acetyltransferase [Pseudomonadota bacterium]